jgi:hypothetical protein
MIKAVSSSLGGFSAASAFARHCIILHDTPAYIILALGILFSFFTIVRTMHLAPCHCSLHCVDNKGLGSVERHTLDAWLAGPELGRTDL